MHRTSTMDSRGGSVLILVVVVSLFIAALAGTMLTMTLTGHRASAENLEMELAYRNANSGVSYVYAMLNGDRDYLRNLEVPTGEIICGDGSFRIDSAAEGDIADSWQVAVTGLSGNVEYEMAAVFGYNRIPVPPGLVATGTGKATDVIADFRGATTVASFDSSEGAYNSLMPGTEAIVGVNGSITLADSTKVNGDVNATGTIKKSGTASITGAATASSAPTDVDDIDPLVSNLLASSKTANDNANLKAIFGAAYVPIKSTQNYGDLIVTSGKYVVPAGTYRFRRLEVRNGATVTFDTSTGPANIVYVGSGAGTGTGNDLIVDGVGSALGLDSKTTKNGLLTVLAPDCDFTVSNSGKFGQNAADTGSGGYTQLISLGGNTSSDDIRASTNATVYGRVYAAAHAFFVESGASWFGSALTRRITLNGTGKAVKFVVDLSSVGNSLLDTSSFDLYTRWHIPEAQQ